MYIKKNSVVKAITVSALRKRMKKYFDEVCQSSEVLIIPRKKDEDACHYVYP
jgi:antitoxin YefM